MTLPEKSAAYDAFTCQHFHEPSKVAVSFADKAACYSGQPARDSKDDTMQQTEKGGPDHKPAIFIPKPNMLRLQTAADQFGTSTVHQLQPSHTDLRMGSWSRVSCSIRVSAPSSRPYIMKARPSARPLMICYAPKNILDRLQPHFVMFAGGRYCPPQCCALNSVS